MNVLIVTKIVNTNCIYYNTNAEELNVSQFAINNHKNGVEYYVQNGKYYINENHTKTEIISIQTNTAIQADITYIIMKPLEWLFLAILYLFDEKPENRIATQYIGKKWNFNLTEM